MPRGIAGRRPTQAQITLNQPNQPNQPATPRQEMPANTDMIQLMTMLNAEIEKNQKLEHDYYKLKRTASQELKKTPQELPDESNQILDITEQEARDLITELKTKLTDIQEEPPTLVKPKPVKPIARVVKKASDPTKPKPVPIRKKVVKADV